MNCPGTETGKWPSLSNLPPSPHSPNYRCDLCGHMHPNCEHDAVCTNCGICKDCGRHLQIKFNIVNEYPPF